jgi:hypothetical protein
MPQRPRTDAQCQEAIDAVARTGGNILAAGRLLGEDESTVRRRLEDAISRGLKPTTEPVVFTEFPNWLTLEVKNGTVLVGSDAHYWPGFVSTAHKAFVHLCRDLQPKAVVMNGDVMDFPAISRHAPIGWENRPKVADEIEAAKRRLGEIETAAPNAKRYWPLGNHDARFESKLAQVAPEYANVHGIHLKDNFPYWHPCWALLVNSDVVIKHRLRGGVHARHNNTLHAGKTIVTGHLHALGVTPFSDLNGTRWGVDTGTLADPYGPQFENYTEQGPLNWRSGFAVLTFKDGQLLDPEIVRVIGERKVSFRGEVIRV